MSEHDIDLFRLSETWLYQDKYVLNEVPPPNGNVTSKLQSCWRTLSTHKKSALNRPKSPILLQCFFFERTLPFISVLLDHNFPKCVKAVSSFGCASWLNVNSLQTAQPAIFYHHFGKNILTHTKYIYFFHTHHNSCAEIIWSYIVFIP